MVEVAKVSARFKCAIPNVQRSFIFNGYNEYFTINRQYTQIDDPFNMITEKSATDLVMGPVTLTGFLIPYSRRYTISIVYKPALIYAATAISVGTGVTYALSESALNLRIFNYGQTDLVYSGDFYLPVNGVTFGSGPVAANFPASKIIISATLTHDLFLEAGSFISFSIFTEIYNPPSGTLSPYTISPEIYFKIAEISDI